jgi:hypothetical protein
VKEIRDLVELKKFCKGQIVPPAIVGHFASSEDGLHIV